MGGDDVEVTDGECCFEGVASSEALDRQQERMTARALEKMARHRGLELRDGHRGGKKLGGVEAAWVEDGRLRVRGKLAEPVNEETACGLSVGGKVNEAFWGWDTHSGELIRYVDDVELDHVAVCAPEAAVNPETWLRVVWRKVKGALGKAGRRGNGEEGVRRAGRLPAPPNGTGTATPDGAGTAASDGESGGLTEEDGGVVATEDGKVAVRRGEPQGLGGQEVRHVSAARLWEGVL